MQIYNQMTETHKIRDLAKMVSGMTGVDIDWVVNPRNEAEENELHVVNEKFLGHGLEPITLQGGLLSEITDIAKQYAHRCDIEKVPCVSFWNAARSEQAKAEPTADQHDSAMVRQKNKK